MTADQGLHVARDMSRTSSLTRQERGVLFHVIVGFIRLLDLTTVQREQPSCGRDDSTLKERCVVRIRLKQETTQIFEWLGRLKERIFLVSAGIGNPIFLFVVRRGTCPRS